jgi:hypothetical protein
MSVGDHAGRSPLRFLLLVFLLTVPFLLLAALNDGQVAPGVPLAGLAAVVRAHAPAPRGGAGAVVRQLLSFVILRLRGVDVPDPSISVTSTLLLAVGCFMGALGEELGWSGTGCRCSRWVGP